MTSLPPSYDSARRRMLAAAAEVRARVRSDVGPGAGPSGQPLVVDTVCLGDPDAPVGALLISGTHGVEGYAGSAVQHRLLVDGSAVRLGEQGVHVVLVHALNPYGFAWDRRVTAEGVDLMRNVVDHDDPPHDDPVVSEVAALLVPADLHGPRWSAAEQELRRWTERYGYDRLRTAVARGQYRHPDLPFYGGRAPVWSQRVFRSIVSEQLARHSAVIALDIHTGLGANGTGQLIGTHPVGSAVAERGRSTWGGDYVTNGARGSVSYPFTGSLLLALDEELSDGPAVVSAVHEFGTQPEASVLAALRADHTLYAGAVDPAQLVEVRAMMRAAFTDEHPDWIETVYHQSREALHRAVQAVSQS